MPTWSRETRNHQLQDLRPADDIQGVGNIIFSNSPKLNRPWSLYRCLGWQNLSTKIQRPKLCKKSLSWCMDEQTSSCLFSMQSVSLTRNMFTFQFWSNLKGCIPKPVGEFIQNHSFGMSEDAGTTISETLCHRCTGLDTSRQLASYQDLRLF